MSKIQEIINRGKKDELRALFGFTKENSNEEVLVKFNLWARYFFVNYFTSKDAPFHRDVDLNNIKIYRAELKTFVNVLFRNSAKTTRTKLFRAFVIANDLDHSRKYCKILTKDLTNAKQFVTDVYNMLISPRVAYYYPEVFAKTTAKREETMNSFTTATGVKLTAGTVGTEQRGQLQDDARPDEVIFDDFETRKTLRSAVETQAIWDNMEEARTGLSKNGGCVFCCNYISERGNVHKIIQKNKDNEGSVVIIIPIIKDGVPTWDRFTLEDIEQIKRDADDFEGEYLGNPSAGMDVFIDRKAIERQEEMTPIEDRAGFRMYKKYDPSHRYAIGGDVAAGVGLDSSATVAIDFSCFPAQVVGAYANNTITPDVFGNEMARQGDILGTCLLAPEKNNHGIATIQRLKEIYDTNMLHETQGKVTRKEYDEPERKEYGWHTNLATKPSMMFDLKKVVEDGFLELNDPRLIAEAKSYSRDDLLDSDIDPRLSTRHHDLLIACAIAFQMKDFATVTTVQDEEELARIRLEEASFDKFEPI